MPSASTRRSSRGAAANDARPPGLARQKQSTLSSPPSRNFFLRDCRTHPSSLREKLEQERKGRSTLPFRPGAVPRRRRRRRGEILCRHLKRTPVGTSETQRACSRNYLRAGMTPADPKIYRPGVRRPTHVDARREEGLASPQWDTADCRPEVKHENPRIT